MAFKRNKMIFLEISNLLRAAATSLAAMLREREASGVVDTISHPDCFKNSALYQTVLLILKINDQNTPT
jgi:hypothetical protein